MDENVMGDDDEMSQNLISVEVTSSGKSMTVNRWHKGDSPEAIKEALTELLYDVAKVYDIAL